jgi:hypothetical protein
VVLVVASFFVGNWYGSKKGKTTFGANNLRAGAQFGAKGPGGQIPVNRNGARAGVGAGGLTRGEVVTKDANTITLKLIDGGSKVLLYSTSTLVNKTVNGSLDDIKVGENLMVTGDVNSDGSITAKSLQLVPVITTSTPKK